MDGLRPLRPSGFAADVEDVGSLLDQSQALRDGLLRRKKLPSVAEAIGRNVDDAEDDGPVERKGAAADGPGRHEQSEGIGGCSRLREGLGLGKRRTATPIREPPFPPSTLCRRWFRSA